MGWNTDSKYLKSELTNCTYLEDSDLEIHGLKIFGSPYQPPYQPEFDRSAVNLERGQECLGIWKQIPSDTDILVTHGPPLGFGDLCKRGNRAGCVDLLHTVQQRVKPKYHVFGHIHEGKQLIIVDNILTLLFKHMDSHLMEKLSLSMPQHVTANITQVTLPLSLMWTFLMDPVKMLQPKY